MSAANTNISALRAEVLLNHLYPEQSDSWVVTNKGTFYRNYSEDVLQLDANLSQVSLSRDGLLRLLPQGLVSTKDELKEAEELFVPFDSWRFRDSLRAEEDFAYLLENKLNIILKTYYGVDIEAETNPLIKEMMKLLPQASSIRGNFHKIGDILKALLNKRVTTHITCYNWSDKTADTQPMVCYKVWMPELTSESYKELEKNIEALKNFLVEWFIPFDTYCAIEIKTEQTTSLNNTMLLNYNTKLSL